MKHVLMALFVSGSLSAFAQDYHQIEVLNLTNPKEQLTIACKDESCETFKIKIPKRQHIHTSRHQLESAIDNRGRYVLQSETPGESYGPYDITKQTVEAVGENFEEGRTGKAIANMVLVPGAVALDTVALGVVYPARAAIKLASTKHRYTVQGKKGAKLIKEALESGEKELRLVDKKFNQILDFASSADRIEEFGF